MMRPSSFVVRDRRGRMHSISSSLIHAVVGIAIACGFSDAVLADPIDDVVNQVDQAVYQHYLDDLLYTHLGDNRGIDGPEHNLARDNIYATFQSFGLESHIDDFPVDDPQHANVVGIHWGTLFPNQVYVLGAHYDSADNPGADDDASGVAAVMEAARVLSQHEFVATIIFVAFDMEERKGLRGSKHFVADHEDNDLRSMIQLDMIAYNPSQHNRVRMCDSEGEPNPLKAQITEAFDRWTPIEAFSVCSTYVSDHLSFERVGVTACAVTEYDFATNPHYHRSTDSVDMPDFIDYAYATQITRAVVGSLATSAGLIHPEVYHLADPSPGVVRLANDFAVSGGTPNLQSFFVYGLNDGLTNVPGCPGTTVSVANPRVIGSAVADGEGVAMISGYVPVAAIQWPVFIQAVEPGTCRSTNRVEYQFELE